MAKTLRNVSWLATATGWFSSVFPGTWGVMLGAFGTTAIAWASEGAQIFTNPKVIGAAMFFAVSLWTFIGLAWLTNRLRPIQVTPVRDYRYGLTFQGAQAFLDLANPEGSLIVQILFQNYSSSPLRYNLESSDLRIETRSLPHDQKIAISNFMSRGASRTITLQPFKRKHIEEFLQTRQEGMLKFSITYGDAENEFPSRRLEMTLKIYFAFPGIDEHFPGMPHVLGFNHIIENESDTAID